MDELIAAGRRTGLGLYSGLVSLWCTLRNAACQVMRDIDRDTKRNPGLICAVAGVAIIIVWLATGGRA